MIVQCLKTQSSCDPLVIPRNLQNVISETNYVMSTEWYTVTNKISGYRISQGKKYTVYAVVAFNEQIRYLIFDDDNIPGFFPSVLFSISNSDIFLDWEVCEYDIESKILFVMGYPALCKDYSSLVGLIECQNQHIEGLLSYKNHMNSFCF